MNKVGKTVGAHQVRAWEGKELLAVRFLFSSFHVHVGAPAVQRRLWLLNFNICITRIAVFVYIYIAAPLPTVVVNFRVSRYLEVDDKRDSFIYIPTASEVGLARYTVINRVFRMSQ